MIKLKEVMNPIKEAVDEGDFVSAMQEIRAGLDEAEYGINSLDRLGFKGYVLTDFGGAHSAALKEGLD